MMDFIILGSKQIAKPSNVQLRGVNRMKIVIVNNILSSIYYHNILSYKEYKKLSLVYNIVIQHILIK